MEKREKMRAKGMRLALEKCMIECLVGLSVEGEGCRLAERRDLLLKAKFDKATSR